MKPHIMLPPLLRRWRGDYRLRKCRRHETTEFRGGDATLHELRVLFYDLEGLTFGGTQKCLQILAKHLTKEVFAVYYMYAPEAGEERLSYIQNGNVKLIPFTFENRQCSIPFYMSAMRPHIFDVLSEHGIEVVVTAGVGFPEFPIANISNLPIVYFNIFGSINPQTNIRKTFCISNYLAELVRTSLPNHDVETLYIQSEGPDPGAEERGRELRNSLCLSDDACVFGRIGRPADHIFDPIGIRAFKKTVETHPNAHYLIMAPAPAVVEIVSTEKIPNVHFLPPSGREDDVWAFHHSIDILAHFRKDGETMGLNIAESMLCSRPVITHRSRIYNAHLEYLDESFSRVADVDAVGQYASFMEYFLSARRRGELAGMGKKARMKAEPLFLIENNIAKFEESILVAAGRPLNRRLAACSRDPL